MNYLFIIHYIGLLLTPDDNYNETSIRSTH